MWRIKKWTFMTLEEITRQPVSLTKNVQTFENCLKMAGSTHLEIYIQIRFSIPAGRTN